MKSAIALSFVMFLILLSDNITDGADIGLPTWKLGKTTGNMRDCQVTVPVTKVTTREAVSCTVHIIGTDGTELAQGMMSDIFEKDGKLSRTFQIRGSDAAAIGRIMVDR